MTQVGDIWYRVEGVVYASMLDEYDYPSGPSRPDIRVDEYEVIKLTPKGVWLDVNGRKRLVLNDTAKRFALPTRDEAFESFRRRKMSQIKILTNQLSIAQKQLKISLMARLTLA